MSVPNLSKEGPAEEVRFELSINNTWRLNIPPELGLAVHFMRWEETDCPHTRREPVWWELSG